MACKHSNGSIVITPPAVHSTVSVVPPPGAVVGAAVVGNSVTGAAVVGATVVAGAVLGAAVVGT